MTIDFNGVGRAATPSSTPTKTSESKVQSPKPAAQEKRAPSEDSVDVSESARALQAGLERASTGESFDAGRVNEIRQALAEGRYQIDNERVAAQFMKIESMLGG